MKTKIIGILVSVLLILTIIPVVSTTNIKNTNANEQTIITSIQDTVPFYEGPHHVTIRLRNIYITESGDDGINEHGEYYFFILAIPAMFHWRTDIYLANDNIPDTPQNFGKLCTMNDIKFTPQRLIILALEDDRGEGIANFNEFMDWIQIKFRPPKDDYPHTDMYEETFKWVNIYFRADVVVQFYYIDESPPP
jgi:hypothetical protein